ncbi:HIT family protein [Nonomuraea rhodomycinica]|uniref:HIT family protein n=1 Tax=Nonomuraea rhodomycinica TaxID=1712872 RepID=A0A7Y6IY34_9ACTN|nr:HIT family protein [Nonomuraea rhodomycinica]NUW46526.1 HIT family protein [Nonomuraea rhodomycinica]
MSTDLFCEIVAGRRPAFVVHSDAVAVSFLDARPLFKGHVLVVPRRHVETLADLPAADVGPFFARVQALARAVEEAMEAAGTFVAMNNHVSQSVPHLHVHVVPRNRKDGLRGFFWPRTKYDSDDEARAYAAAVAGALAAGQAAGAAE